MWFVLLSHVASWKVFVFFSLPGIFKWFLDETLDFGRWIILFIFSTIKSALNLHLHAVDLWVSISVSWTAKTRHKLNNKDLTSQLECSKRSDRVWMFFWNHPKISFFLAPRSPFFSYSLGPVFQWVVSGTNIENFDFFWSGIFKRFLDKPMFIEEPSYFVTFSAMIGLWDCTSTWYPCECQWPWDEQRRLHKS